jgi:hypothetical protein
MLKSMDVDRVLIDPADDTNARHPIDAVLSDPHWVSMIMSSPPSPQPDRGGPPDALTAALRAGLPVLIWHPYAQPRQLLELVEWLAAERPIEMLRRLRMARLATYSVRDLPFDTDLMRDLVVLWDDPTRIVVYDESGVK